MRDESLALLREGYAFTRSRRAPGSPAYLTRLAGHRALVVGGEEGARLFYDADRMRRRRAIPAPTKWALFGKGAVHGLDGAEHALRKSLFTALLDQTAVDLVVASADRRWSRMLDAWPEQDSLAVQAAACVVLGGAALEWVGIDSTPEDVVARSGELFRVVDGFGSFGRRWARSAAARYRSQKWIRAAVERARRRPETASHVLRTVAAHRGPDGSLLDLDVAAVEVHNLLRPTVAVSWLVTYSVLALSADSALRERIAADEPGVVEAFAHEVRRLYPFVPLLAAVATRDFTWMGQSVRRGQLVVLDVVGSSRDPAAWPRPDEFDVNRFRGREPGAFELLAQGGGDARTGHRCPGERLAVELVKNAARRLSAVPWTLGGGDLRTARRMPPDLREVRIRSCRVQSRAAQ